MKGRIVTKTATLTVDDDDDGYLGAVGDTAIVDIADLERVSIFVNRVVDGTDGVAAELDLGTLAAGNLDTVVRARTQGAAGNSITVAATGDRTDGTVTIAEVGNAVTIHYDDDVSTVEDVEDAITDDSTLIEVKTAGTGATVLDAATDDFAAEALAGGSDEGTIAILLETTVDGTNFAEQVTIDESDFADGSGVAFEWSLSDARGMPICAKQVRVSIVTLGETSEFSVTAVGSSRE